MSRLSTTLPRFIAIVIAAASLQACVADTETDQTGDIIYSIGEYDFARNIDFGDANEGRFLVDTNEGRFIVDSNQGRYIVDTNQGRFVVDADGTIYTEVIEVVAVLGPVRGFEQPEPEVRAQMVGDTNLIDEDIHDGEQF